jgi:lysophospholipase L1-like esterase
MIGQNMYGRIAAVAAALVLAACGGGGGGDGGSSEPAPVVKPACYLADGQTCIINDASVARAKILTGDQSKLKALFAKMKVGGHYVIGFEGGSITVGEKGWPDIGKTYAGMVFLWFQTTFPNSTFDMKNDAVSGTTSAQGAARYPAFAELYHPDITFVEFAVNDRPQYYTDAGTVEVWYGQMMDAVTSTGGIPVALETMKPDCSSAQPPHYAVYAAKNLPLMVSQYQSVCAILATVPQADWNADGTHPNYLGHQILAVLLTKNLETLISR